MAEEKPAARSKRPCLVFRAGGSRFALPATAVLEVADVAAAPGATHNGLPVEPLAQLFALPPDGEGGVTLVLDSAPPRALYVGAVEEVADLSTSHYLHLPTGAETPASHLFRGAVLLGSRLVLELLPDPLANFTALPQRTAPSPSNTSEPVVPAPDRALTFVAGDGELFAVPLGVVTRIIGPPQLVQVPYARAGLVGILEHERSLLPVFDPAFMLARGRTEGQYVVALDVGSASLGLLARDVKGVVPELCGPVESIPGGTLARTPDGSQVLVPALEGWAEAR